MNYFTVSTFIENEKYIFRFANLMILEARVVRGSCVRNFHRRQLRHLLVEVGGQVPLHLSGVLQGVGLRLGLQPLVALHPRHDLVRGSVPEVEVEL